MTQEDINLLFECVRADFKIIVRKTELWSMEQCEEYLYDIEQFLRSEYISQIFIVMRDSLGAPIRCNKYVINAQLKSSSIDRPGNIDWDGLGGVELSVILSYSNKFRYLSSYEQSIFFKTLKVTWGSTHEDTTFPNLNKNVSKTYSGSDSSINRIDFNNGTY